MEEFWTTTQKRFMKDHPEVFEEAEDPSQLERTIYKFTAYHWNDGEVLTLVLGWAEVRQFGVAFSGKIIKKANGLSHLKFYLQGPIINDSLLFLVVSVDEKFTQEQTIKAIKSRFESEYLFPLSKLPFIEKGIINLINR